MWSDTFLIVFISICTALLGEGKFRLFFLFASFFFLSLVCVQLISKSFGRHTTSTFRQMMCKERPCVKHILKLTVLLFNAGMVGRHSLAALLISVIVAISAAKEKYFFWSITLDYRHLIVLLIVRFIIFP